jgi:Domain of unknown function (DUF4397)
LEKIMKNRIRLTFALALLCAALSTATYASSLYLVQGLPGRDVAADTDPAYPVDVLINDEICYQRGLAFGTVAGPLTFLPGTINVKVSIANSLAPCSESPLIDTTVSIEAKSDYSAVIALSQTGTPTLLTFKNGLAPVAANMGRVLFAQAADAPAVQVVLENTATKRMFTYTVQPGALLNTSLPAGDYTVEVNQGTTNLVPSTPVTLFSQSVTMLFAVGEASNNTVTLESKTVRDVI